MAVFTAARDIWRAQEWMSIKITPHTTLVSVIFGTVMPNVTDQMTRLIFARGPDTWTLMRLSHQWMSASGLASTCRSAAVIAGLGTYRSCNGHSRWANLPGVMCQSMYSRQLSFMTDECAARENSPLTEDGRWGCCDDPASSIDPNFTSCPPLLLSSPHRYRFAIDDELIIIAARSMWGALPSFQSGRWREGKLDLYSKLRGINRT